MVGGHTRVGGSTVLRMRQNRGQERLNLPDPPPRSVFVEAELRIHSKDYHNPLQRRMLVDAIKELAPFCGVIVTRNTDTDRQPEMEFRGKTYVGLAEINELFTGMAAERLKRYRLGLPIEK